MHGVMTEITKEEFVDLCYKAVRNINESKQDYIVDHVLSYYYNDIKPTDSFDKKCFIEKIDKIYQENKHKNKKHVLITLKELFKVTAKNMSDMRFVSFESLKEKSGDSLEYELHLNGVVDDDEGVLTPTYNLNISDFLSDENILFLNSMSPKVKDKYISSMCRILVPLIKGLDKQKLQKILNYAVEQIKTIDYEYVAIHRSTCSYAIAEWARVRERWKAYVRKVKQGKV